MSMAAGSTSLVVDILTNTSMLSSGLAQAEAQVTHSGGKMGKAMETAGTAMSSNMLKGLIGRAGKIGMIVGAVDMIGSQLREAMSKNTDVQQGFMDMLASIGDLPGIRQVIQPLRQYGEEYGRAFTESFFESVSKNAAARGGFGAQLQRSERFFEGTEYGLFEYIQEYIGQMIGTREQRNIRAVAPFGIAQRPNENLIRGLQSEYATLMGEQQVLTQQDRRSQMIQARLAVGYGQVGTALGGFNVAFGTPEDASRKVAEAAIKQLQALERIQVILETLGPNAGN